MDELRIELKDFYNSLKAIYYANGRGSFFTYTKTKTSLILTLSTVFSTIVLYLIALYTLGSTWFILFVAGPFAITAGLVSMSVEGSKYFRWKRATDSYLNNLRKYKKHWLILTSYTVELSNEDETSIDRWSAVTFVAFNPDYVLLRAGGDLPYVLPEKSMEPNEYIKLKEFIRQRINANPSKIDQSVYII